MDSSFHELCLTARNHILCLARSRKGLVQEENRCQYACPRNIFGLDLCHEYVNVLLVLTLCYDVYYRTSHASSSPWWKPMFRDQGHPDRDFRDTWAAVPPRLASLGCDLSLAYLRTNGKASAPSSEHLRPRQWLQPLRRLLELRASLR